MARSVPASTVPFFPGGRSGDGHGMDVTTLVTDHMPLADSISRRIAARLPRHTDTDALRSAAYLGLTQAAKAFDPTIGAPFNAFARRRIVGAVYDELRRNDPIPRTIRSDARLLRTATEHHMAATGTQPTRAELAIATGLPVERVVEVQQRDQVRTGNHVQIDLADPASTEDVETTATDRRALAEIADAVDTLPERLRTVVIGFYMESETLASIGSALGVSESRACQMRGEAIRKLRGRLAAA